MSQIPPLANFIPKVFQCHSPDNTSHVGGHIRPALPGPSFPGRCAERSRGSCHGPEEDTARVGFLSSLPYRIDPMFDAKFLGSSWYFQNRRKIPWYWLTVSEIPQTVHCHHRLQNLQSYRSSVDILVRLLTISSFFIFWGCVCCQKFDFETRPDLQSHPKNGPHGDWLRIPRSECLVAAGPWVNRLDATAFAFRGQT